MEVEIIGGNPSPSLADLNKKAIQKLYELMDSLDGEIDSGNWYPVIDDGIHTFAPHRSKDGSVTWRRIESVRKAE